MNWIFVVALSSVWLLWRVRGDDDHNTPCCQPNKREGRDSTWQDSWSVYPRTSIWSLQTRIPMIADADFDFQERTKGESRGKFKVKKKYKKFLLPLLMAYKLKFFTLIPVLIGGLVLLVGATGLAGFFFALFAAVMGLKTGGGGH